MTELDDSLSSGVANSVFPAGLTAGLGLTVQSNTLGGLADTASPLGVNGLATASVGFLGSASDQVHNAVDFHSFDMIFASSGTVGVAFTPLVLRRMSPRMRGPGLRNEEEVWRADERAGR